MNKRKTSIRAGAAVLGAAAVTGITWMAIPAEAATTGVVSKVSGNVVVYTAATGKANTVVLTRSGTTVTVDDVYGIKAGAGCSAVSGDTTKIRCAGAAWVRVDLGNGNDKLINNSGLGMTAWGRAGNDQITGGPLKDDVYGGDGADSLWGNAGNDQLRGEGGGDAISGGEGNDTVADGPGNDKVLGGNGDDWFITAQGNDTFDGGAGDDEMDQPNDYAAGTDRDSFTGGLGLDAVDYQFRTKAVTADADGVARDDGSAGEGDTISSSIEVLGGGNAADRLIGTARNEGLIGGPGNDTIAASTGDDVLWGEAGSDLLNGAGGTDWCIDYQSNDTMVSCELVGPQPEASSAAVARSADTTLVELMAKVRAARK